MLLLLTEEQINAIQILKSDYSDYWLQANLKFY